MKKLWTRFAFTAAVAFAVGFASTLTGTERFDLKVRNDFFAGLAGNKEAMDRAMKQSEEVLAANPQHAEAMVWHGIGLFATSRNYFQSGDVKKGLEVFMRGQQEMDRAVEIEPDSIAVRIPRGAALISAGRAVSDPQQARRMLEKGLADYERVYELQQNSLLDMGQHPRGELLFGIADTSSRLGNQERAAEFFDKITASLPDTVYAKRAAMWRETKSLPVDQTRCVGCHTAALK